MAVRRGLLWKERQVQLWKILVGVLILPVYFFNPLLLHDDRQSQIAVILLALLAAFFGAETVAEEHRTGTWNFLAALPLSRRRLLAVKFGTGLACLLLSVGGALLAVLVIMPRTAITAARIAPVFLDATLFFCVAFFASALSRSSAWGWGAGVAAGITAAFCRQPRAAVGLVPALPLHGDLAAFAVIVVAFGFLFVLLAFLLARNLASIFSAAEAAIIGLERRRLLATACFGSAAALAAGFLLPAWALPIPFAGLAVWLGASQVAPDRQRGQLAWLYALPIPAARVLWAKYQAGTLLILPLAFVAFLMGLSSGSVLTLIQCLAVFPLFMAAFFASGVLASRLQVVAVALCGISAFLLHPIFLLPAIIAVPLSAGVPEWLLAAPGIWWPKFDRRIVSTHPWGGMFLPAVGILLIPTALAWIGWYSYLTSSILVMSPLAHFRDLRGNDLVVWASRLWIRGEDDVVEERRTDSPEVLISTMRLTDRQWADFGHASRVCEIPGAAEYWNAARGERMLATEVPRRDRMTASGNRGSPWSCRAYSTPRSFSGVPNPALAIAAGPRLNGLQYAFLPWTWFAEVVMSFPEEAGSDAEGFYRALAVDDDEARIYLVGDGGLTIAASPLSWSRMEEPPHEEGESSKRASPPEDDSRIQAEVDSPLSLSSRPGPAFEPASLRLNNRFFTCTGIDTFSLVSPETIDLSCGVYCLSDYPDSRRLSQMGLSLRPATDVR